MSRVLSPRPFDDSIKENPKMHSRRALGVLIATAAMILLAMPAASASAAAPWWQVLTGSRPTYLWEPEDSVQEIGTTVGEYPGLGEGTAAGVEVEGETVGCLGTNSSLSNLLCGASFGFPPAESAQQLEAMLEAAFGTPNVEVSGGPVGGDPFKIVVPDRSAPIIVRPNQYGVGSARKKTVSVGGSGRLVLTITNLGDAPVDGSSAPVSILDELPAGVEATAVQGFAGLNNMAGPLNCMLDSSSQVSCTFEGELPPYEALEVEISVSLVGEPPHAGAAGKVTVSGGNAPLARAEQSILVSPETTPFGIEKFFGQAEDEGGAATIQAGSHPFQMTTTVQLNAGRPVDRSEVEQPAQPRNLRFPLPAGLVGNAKGLPQCNMNVFVDVTPQFINECPDEAAVGVASVTLIAGAQYLRVPVPVFNLPPTQGEPARFGFMVSGDPVLIDTAVDPGDDYRIIASVRNTTQIVQFLSSTVTLWGTPGDSRHDASRGWACVFRAVDVGPCERPSGLSEAAFLRVPVACASSLDFAAEAEPWNVPAGSVVDRKRLTQPALGGCNKVPFNPTIAAAPTSKLAANPSGFDFDLTLPNSGLLAKDAIAEGQAKKVEVVLPQGMTINPSEGEGLVGCSPAELARETASSAPGEGCPQASRIGEVQVQTPLLDEEARGSLYVATPRDNRFGSLLALYMVAKIPERGILIRQAGKVSADPVTGQLTTTFDDLPQLPYSSFKLHFREGGRAPLVTPPACGHYDVVARFTPWSARDPENPTPEEIVTRTSSFDVERGVDGGACPSGGTPPFHPNLTAGTRNNAAGSYSPFNLRLTRKDGEQEFTHFSIKLPPGVIGKLAGIPFCPDAAIAAAKARTGDNGGAEELASPSCPAASQVGSTLVGAGVGGSLTFVPGKVYLAGPYHGSQLSIAAITAAKVGPFDLGTVVVREALRINPETAEVFVDSAGSDPIPHIIQGIPVHARDIRVEVDRPQFVLNPTNCKRTSVASTVLGSGLDFGSAADDVPVTVTSPFQAADCAKLGFRPKLKLRLIGGTKRGANPKLRATLTARKGDANLEQAQVTLPHSEFLDNAHIRTICTRAQFAAGEVPGEQCPAGSVYGYAKATTPLLDQPIQGRVYLRSSSHPLPDLVAALHSDRINVNVDGRIDSFGAGRIRTTFEDLPDAPITKFVLTMKGGKKGLLINSTDICKGKHRALVGLDGQNEKASSSKVPLRAKCGKRK